MKKLAILFLLTAVLVSFSFAEASVKVDLSFNNLGEGNNGKMDPALGFIFTGTGAQDLGPGSLGFGAMVSPRLHFSKDAGTGAQWDTDDNAGWVNYSLAAGPGTLGFGLSLIMGSLDLTSLGYPGTVNLGIVWKPSVDYTGLAAGPATLGFGTWYKFKTTGIKSNGDASPFGKEFINSDNNDDDVGFWVTAAFDFGLFIKYEFVYGIGVGEIAQISYLDVNYKVMDALLVGVELDATANKAGDVFKGFLVKPYVEYGLNDNMSVGAYFKLGNISADAPNDDMIMTPGVWFKYSL